MSEELRITPRNLGCINLATYCPACFKYLLHQRFQPPHGMKAAIFTDAQKCQEAILGYYFENDGGLPSEFDPFCDCVGRVDCNKHWSKFKHLHESGVLLYGSPDEVLRRKDGSICIIDHKTAHNKGDKDEFHGQYVTQVTGYSHIAEGMGFGEATNGGLLYWWAQVEAVQADPSSHYKRATLSMPFKPCPLEVKLDYKMLPPLIKEFKKVWNASQVPDSREGCEDCKKRNLLFAIEEQFNRQDRVELQDYASMGWESRRRQVRDRIARKADDRRKLLAEFGAVGDAIFSRNGMVANWEFLPPDAASE
jgi:hypothetical protein